MSEVESFFQNEEIFVTGGSGVVGRALIEKLLRSCDVKRIYMLLRPKKGVSVVDRLAKFRAHKIFDELCSQKPCELEKLVAVPGDIELDNLGITTEYAQRMANVSLIYHCAATVRFDEPLHRAINMNIGGTLAALTFAETLRHLRLFIHVSTFYSNPYLDFVEAKVYPPPMDWKLCLRLARNENCDGAIRFLTKKIITGFPNTYCFTKNVAESMVNEFCDRIPIAIFRPSIVMFSLEEPIPGFPPSAMGAMGLFLGVAAGVIKTVYMDPLMLDVMPQDCMVKALAFYSMHACKLNAQGKQKSVPVYVVSSMKYFKGTLAEVPRDADKLDIWKIAAFEKAFLLPGCRFTNNRLVYMSIVYVKQLLPAILGDLLIRLFGHKPAILGIQRKVYLSMHEMRAFMFNRFDSDGTTLEHELIYGMKDTPFGITKTVMHSERPDTMAKHLLNSLFAMREQLLGEDPETIRKSRRIHELKQFVYNVIRLSLGFYTCQKLLSLEYGQMFDSVIDSLTRNVTQ